MFCSIGFIVKLQRKYQNNHTNVLFVFGAAAVSKDSGVGGDVGEESGRVGVGVGVRAESEDAGGDLRVSIREGGHPSLHHLVQLQAINFVI